MNIIWKSVKSKLLVAGILVAMLVIGVSPISVSLNNPLTQQAINFELGHVQAVWASGTLDQPLTQVGIQAALDALPATGGRINIFNNAAGTVTFTGTVSRAIPNVTIIGTGKVPLFQNNGVTALFSVGGQTGWIFRDVTTDAGGVTLASDTVLDNVQLGGIYYAQRSSTGTSVLFTANISILNAPIGRGATYVVAASDAPALIKAQADYISDGIGDEVQINAAITAAVANGGGKVLLSSSNFSINGNIEIKSNIYLQGQGMGVTAIRASNSFTPGRMINYDGTGAPTYANFITISDLELDGNKSAFGDTFPRLGIAIIYANYVTIFNTYIHDIYEACGITVGHTGDISPFIGVNVFNNWIVDTDRNGIDATGAGVNYAVYLQNNKIRGSGWNGITLDGNNGRILNNYIVNSSTSNLSTYYSIYASGTKHQIRDNFTSGTSVLAQIGSIASDTAVDHNKGYVTENSGSSVGTGSQQTIDHGLSFTPTKQQIGIFSDNSTGTAYQSANSDATNIYVTEITDSAWHWATVGN